MFKSIRRKLVGKSARKGYTMTELLTVIGIIAVVVAIAIPSIIAIQRRLTYRQNNEYAKEVFLAAQANLTDMRSKGTLTQLQGDGVADAVTEAIDRKLYHAGIGPDGKTQEYYYMNAENTAFGVLLPPTSIDSKVRNADIVIDYNPITGNVYSVFYFHKTGKLDLIDKYESGAFQREDDKLDDFVEYLKDNLIGYYDGSTLVSSGLTREKNKDATLDFVNGEEGIVTVTIPINPKYATNPQAFMEGLDVDLTVEGQNIAEEEDFGEGNRTGNIIVKAKTAGTIPNGLKDSRCICELDGEGNVVISYVLDSLYDNKSFANLVYGDTADYLYEQEENFARVTPKKGTGSDDASTCLTDIADEKKFKILPGDNVNISAEIDFTPTGSNPGISEISVNSVEDVNPMFGELTGADNKLILRLDNGRNMQNLNAVAPTVAEHVSNVDFSKSGNDGKDINWNTTVKYYNDKYNKGSTYRNAYGKADGNNNQAPARALPYFVPINNEHLFGAASFVYPNDASLGAEVLRGLAKLISDGVTLVDDALGSLVDITRDSSDTAVFNAVNQIFDLDKDTPTLSDELATDTTSNAIVNGNGNAVYYLNINTNAYRTCKQDVSGGYYAGCTAGMAQNYSEGGYTSNYKDDSFAGLFGYVNTTIRNLDIVNPKVKGAKFEEADTYRYVQEISGETLIFRWKWGVNADVRKDRNRGNNPCAGALVGCCGWNAYLENCGAYIDTKDKDFAWSKMNQTEYKNDTNEQSFYGVSGSGAVGGLVGYCRSHKIFSGNVSDFTKEEGKLAYKECFASVPVSGLMRGADSTSVNDDKRYYGYTNGVGGLVGNAELTNFYNCYSGSTVLADGVYIDSSMWDVGGLNDLLRSWSDNLNDNMALLGDNVLDLSYNGRTSMGAGGLVGTSHGSVYRNCFTASSVDATNPLSTTADKKKSGCAGFVGVMCYQESFAYGNDYTTEDKVTVDAGISQKSMFLNCYSAGLSRIRTSKDASYESVAENFNGANARTKTTTLSDLQEYWNGNFYDVYAPAWFNGKTTKSDNYTEVTRKYAYLNDDINALIDPTTNQDIHKGSVVNKTNVNVEALSKDSYVFKDSYYLSGYNNNVGSDTYSRCGLPILYERLENLTATHNSDAWINGQLSVVKNRTVSTLYNNAIQTNDVYKAFIGESKDNKEEAEEDIKNVDPKLWNFAGIYFGEWLNQRISWSGSDLPRENTTIKVGLTDFITGKVLQEIRNVSKGYENTTYRYETSANAGQGGLIARFIINEFASPDKRLDPAYVNQGKTSSIGGGYIAFAADNIDDHTFTIKANTWSTDYTIDKHDHAYWNYHEHFHNRLGDLEYIYKALYKQGYPGTEWTKATASSTHSYEQSAQNAVYPFSVMTSSNGSGIANDFYGTWVTKPLACGLAYYEKYDDGTPEGTYGYYYDSLGTSTLRSDLPVVSDGYAILTANSTDSVRITETTVAKVYGEEEISYNVNESDDIAAGKYDDTVSFEYITGTQTYAVHLLPWEAIEACSHNSSNYYSKLTVRVKVEAKDETGKDIDVSQLGISTDDIDSEGYVTFTMYFNPNAAISQINPAVGGSVLNLNADDPVATFGGNGPKDGTILIRTARQFAAMNNLSGYWYDGIKFEQQLDIDASAYDGSSYGTFAADAAAAANAIEPIGSKANPFYASYNGYGGYTDKAQLGGWDKGISYFGYIGGAGEVKNLVLNCEESYSGSDYIGVLAAENHGNINNVEARIDPAIESISFGAETGAGIIAGYNCGGVIENCDVNIPTGTSDGDIVVNRVNISSAASNVGGIVGCNNEGSVIGGSVSLGSISGSGSVGGIAGSVSGAKNNVISGVTVDVSGISGSSVGGIAGSVTKADISDITLDLSGALNGSSYAGGAIGVNTDGTTISNVGLKLADGMTVEAATAGGFIGDGTYLTVKNLSNLEMNGSINGSELAGGFAGKLGNSSIDGFTLDLKGDVSSDVDAAGFAAIVKGSTVTHSAVYNYGKTISGAGRAAGFAAYLDGTNSECFIDDCDVTGPMTVSSDGDAAGFIVTAEAANNRRVNIESSSVLPVRANISDLETAYRELGKTGYEQIKVNGKENSAGFIVNCTGASIDGCDTVCAVGNASSGNVAGFAVNVDKDGSVARCIANTKVKGSAFILNNVGKVSNSYAWFGAEGSYDSENSGYTSCYIAPRELINGKKLNEIEIQLFDNKGELKMVKLAGLTTADLNGRRDDGTEKGEWKTGDSFNKYPFSEINPPQYMYPMLREHYGDWLNPPQYGFGIVYYEKLANGKTVIDLRDMSDPEVNGGLLSITEAGNFACDTLSTDIDQLVEKAGYMVFYKDAATIKSIDGGTIADKCEELSDSELDKIDFTGLSFNEKQLTSGQIDEFKEIYTFAYIKGTENFTQLEPTEITVTGINVKTPSYTIVPAFGDDIRESTVSHGDDYLIRTGTQFTNISTCYNKHFIQQRNIELENNKNVGSSNEKNSKSGSFEGTYTAKRGEDGRFAIKLNRVNAGIFRNVSSSAKVSDVEVYGGTVNILMTGGNNIGILANTSNGTIENVYMHDCTYTFGYDGPNKNGGSVEAKYAAIVALANSGTISNCTVEKVSFNSRSNNKDGGVIYVGAVTGSSGCSFENVAVNNCSISYNEKDVNKTVYFGGVTGQLTGGSMSGVSVSGNTITLDGAATDVYVGGMIGQAQTAVTAGDTTDTTVSVNTTGVSHVGGVIGSAGNHAVTTGKVTGGSVSAETKGLLYVGGVVGDAASVTVNGEVSTSNIKANNAGAATGISCYVGGVAGQSVNVTVTGAVTNESFDIGTKGIMYYGGVVGATGENGTSSGTVTTAAVTTKLFSMGNTAHQVYAGGVVGKSTGAENEPVISISGAVTNPDWTIECNGAVFAGGIAGENGGNGSSISCGSITNGVIDIDSKSVVYAGGAVGYTLGGITVNGTVTNAKIDVNNSTGAEAEVLVGGVAGNAERNVTVRNVAGTNGGNEEIVVTTKGAPRVGGVLGRLGGYIDVTVSDGYAVKPKIEVTVNFSSGTPCVGGIVGYTAANNDIKGAVSDAEIRVALTSDVAANAGDISVGGAVGKLGYEVEGGTSTSTVDCTVTNCTVTANSQQNIASAGGVVGSMVGGEIKDTTSVDTVTITARSVDHKVFAGGIVGKADANAALAGTVKDPTITATTAGKAYVGGVAGSAASAVNTGSATGLSASVTADGAIYVGGVAGESAGVTATGAVENTSFDLNTKGELYYGGVVGHSSGAVSAAAVTTNSFSLNENKDYKNEKPSAIYSGGVVGKADSTVESAAVTNPDYTLSSTGMIYAGGVAGKAGGDVTVTGDVATNGFTLNNMLEGVSADIYGGGVVGQANGIVSAVNVTNGGTFDVDSNGSAYVGGVVGQSTGGVSAANVNGNNNETALIEVDSAGIAWVGGAVGALGENVSASVSGAVKPSLTVTTTTTSGTAYVGGVVGYAPGGNTISGTVNAPVIHAEAKAATLCGGIVGKVGADDSAAASTVSGTVTNADISAKVENAFTPVGGAIGEMHNASCTATVNGVTFDVTSSDADIISGGLVGYAASGSVSGTATDPQFVNLKAGKSGLVDVYAGGAVGWAPNATVSSSVVLTKEMKIDVSDSGNLVNELYAGGVVGKSGSAVNDLTISGTNGKLTIVGANTLVGFHAGGVAGMAGSLENCTATFENGLTITSNVKSSAAASYAGGIVGESKGDVNSCAITTGEYSTDSTTGAKTVTTSAPLTINAASAGGSVKNLYAGGIAGKSDKAVEGCNVTSTGDMSVGAGARWNVENMYAGGVAGESVGAVSSDTVTALGNNLRILASTDTPTNYYAGGIVGKCGANGENDKLSGCSVDYAGKFQISCGAAANPYAGGIAGSIETAIETSSVQALNTASDKGVLEISEGSATGKTLNIGGIVGEAKNAVTGCSVEVGGFNVTTGSKAETVNLGGIVGTTGGDLSNNTLNVVSDSFGLTNGNSAKASNVFFGGIVGVNNGKTLNGNLVTNADMHYYQSKGASVTEKVTIGGIVGKMTGGSLTDSSATNTDASGAIYLDAQSGASISKTNRTFVVGGAVGKETADGATYSNVKVNVSVDSAFAGSSSRDHNHPTIYGTVGKFIGYVDNGKFTNCSGLGTSDAAYQFLGEINASFIPTTSSNGLFMLSSTSGSVDGAEKSMTAVKSSDTVYTVGNFTFTRTTLDGTYKYSAELGNCLYYDKADNTYYYQKISNDGLYYNKGDDVPHSETKLVETGIGKALSGKYMIADSEGKAITGSTSTDNRGRVSYNLGVMDIKALINGDTFDSLDTSGTYYKAIWEISGHDYNTDKTGNATIKNVNTGYYLIYNGTTWVLSSSSKESTIWGINNKWVIFGYNKVGIHYFLDLKIRDNDVTISIIDSARADMDKINISKGDTKKIYYIDEKSYTNALFTKEVVCELVTHSTTP